MFIPNWEKYRNKRPSGRVQVDWNNPLTNALAISTIDFMANIVNQYQIVTSGGVYINDGLEHDTTTDITYLESGNDQIVSLSEVTILLKYRKTDGTNRSSSAFGFASGTAATRCMCSLPFSDGGIYWDFGGTSNGVSRARVLSGVTFGDDIWAVTSKESGGMRIIQNGMVLVSHAGGVTRSNASGRFGLGLGAGQASDLAKYGFVHVFNRNLSIDEIIELNINPYQLVRSDPTIFLIDTTGPILSSIASSSITDSAADITWTTDEASDSVVEYGLTTDYGSSESNASLVTSHSISLSGLADETLYHYRVKSTDSQGNESISSDQTFTTDAAPDVTGPVISGISVSGLSAVGVNISWTTDEESDSFVEYGLTTDYGANVSNASLVSSHSLAIEGLTAETLYHYRVKSTDAAENESISLDQTFETSAESSYLRNLLLLLGVG
jgi:hypothetical protein